MGESNQRFRTPQLGDVGRRAIALGGQWLALLWVSLCLTGCIQYDIGIDYQGQNHGEIIQQIYLDDSLTRFGAVATETWLNQMEQRAKALGGRFRRVSGMIFQ
ncbi:MAG: hypothetical protein HC881_13935 [Leptolyngbyaceae cyanobacterium SL_7_1]|nr:hypothetical protein [Leptolyngbyaceae cyanobacterium SL_7_1]